MTSRILLNDKETELLNLTLSLIIKGKKRSLFELKSSAKPLPEGNKQAVLETEQSLRAYENLLKIVTSGSSLESFPVGEIEFLSQILSYYIDEEKKEIKRLTHPQGNSRFIQGCQSRLEIYEGIANKIGMH